MTKSKFALLASTACVITLAGGNSAFAQSAGPVAASQLDDVVVTAQRRSENVQNVPIAVTVATGENLTKAGVANVDNISTISPSITFRSTSNAATSGNLQIRGIGTTGNSRAFEGAVGVFIDGVYRVRSGQALTNFLDVDTLQILRGPQGTLFGRNTSAGAILISSVAPQTDSVAGTYDLSYGNYNTYSAKGAVNVPVADNAAFRVAGIYSGRDGYITDPNTGADYSGDESYAVKAQFLYEPTDAASFRLIADYAHSSSECCFATVEDINGSLQPLINGLTLAGGRVLPSSRKRDRQAVLNVSEAQTVKDAGVTLFSNFDVFGGTLNSITAYRDYSINQPREDADFSGADVLQVAEVFEDKFFSQELTFTGKLEGSVNADYLLGAYYSNDEIDATRSVYNGAQGPAFWQSLIPIAEATPGLNSTELLGGTGTSYAAFAHFDFKVASNWNVIVGARYSHDEKQGDFRYSYFNPNPLTAFRLIGAAPGAAYDESRTDEAVTGTLGLQYRPNETAMFYATYNRGYKAGGVNIDSAASGARPRNPAEVPGAVPASAVYKPEFIDAYELGVKLDYWGHRARTNISIFYNDMQDLQVAQFQGLQFAVYNAEAATVSGAEIESSFQLSDAISVNAAVTYLDQAEFAVDPLLSPVLSGRRFANAPEIAANVTLVVDQPITSTLAVTSRAQITYTGEYYDNTATAAIQEGYPLVNFSLGVRSMTQGWALEAYVQNLTDELYGQHFLTPAQNLFGVFDQNEYLAPPRTYGIRLHGSF